MYIRVRVVTKAKKEEVIIKGKNHFEIHVKEKAERNEANKRVLEIISEHFSASARIVSGHHHPIKMLSVNVD